ncbi:hypothetical protein PanWU01x14_244970 [Parasponia andersonii]|uniref:Uncharacterized protein n=1 Tax=Parasponia andersonii TaxID=3476 RepID=A0A2P5BEV2_PARAD|nr:hypothetical protein PanWU01x14_244970 [Parasponia andersonii]
MKPWFSKTLLSYNKAMALNASSLSFTRDLEDAIDRHIVECDRIARALQHLEDDNARATNAISVSEITQIE